MFIDLDLHRQMSKFKLWIVQPEHIFSLFDQLTWDPDAYGISKWNRRHGADGNYQLIVTMER